MIKSIIAGAFAGIRFSHLRATEGAALASNGGATVAVTAAEVDDKSYVLAAVSYCNPKDTFSRPIGRQQASSRLKWLGQQVAQKNFVNEVTYDGKTRYFVVEGTAEAVVPELLASIADDGGYVRAH